MKLAGFFVLNGLLGLVFGLEFLLMPELALSQYGVPTEAHNQMQARYFGATLAAFGLIYWLCRGTRDDTTRRALLVAGVFSSAAGLVLSLWSRTNGLQGPLAWLSVAIYAALLIGSLFFLLRPARRD